MRLLMLDQSTLRVSRNPDAELAARAGMTQPQLSRLESGGATPTVPLLARLAAALDAELDIAFRPHAA